MNKIACHGSSSGSFYIEPFVKTDEHYISSVPPSEHQSPRSAVRLGMKMNQ